MSQYTMSTFGVGMTPIVGGTQLWSSNIGAPHDDESHRVDLGFTFQFYGQNHSSVWVSTNGFITFDSNWAGAFNNQPIPVPDVPNNYIAAFWDDLYIYAAGDTIVSCLTEGASPNRVFTIEWNKIGHINWPIGADASIMTAQIKLYEGTNVVEIHYDTAQNWVLVTCTIGIEDTIGATGVGGPSLANDNSVFPNTNYRFTPVGWSVPPSNKYPIMTHRLQVINGYVSIPDGQIQFKTKLTPAQVLTLIPGSQLIKVGVHGNDQQFIEMPAIYFAAGEDWYQILRAAAED